MTFTETQAKILINQVYSAGGIRNSLYTSEEYHEALRVKFGTGHSEGVRNYISKRFVSCVRCGELIEQKQHPLCINCERELQRWRNENK